MKNNEADDARKNETYKNKILTVPNVLSAFRLLLVPALAWLYLVPEGLFRNGMGAAAFGRNGYCGRLYCAEIRNGE